MEREGSSASHWFGNRSLCDRVSPLVGFQSSEVLWTLAPAILLWIPGSSKVSAIFGLQHISLVCQECPQLGTVANQSLPSIAACCFSLVAYLTWVLLFQLFLHLLQGSADLMTICHVDTLFGLVLFILYTGLVLWLLILILFFFPQRRLASLKFQQTVIFGNKINGKMLFDI